MHCIVLMPWPGSLCFSKSLSAAHSKAIFCLLPAPLSLLLHRSISPSCGIFWKMCQWHSEGRTRFISWRPFLALRVPRNQEQHQGAGCHHCSVAREPPATSQARKETREFKSERRNPPPPPPPSFRAASCLWKIPWSPELTKLGRGQQATGMEDFILSYFMYFRLHVLALLVCAGWPPAPVPNGS